MAKPFMDLADALQVVLDLARENILDEKHVCGDLDLAAVRQRQIAACDIVEDMAVNQFGDD